MRLFYQRLFPWRYLFQWLNHSPTPTNDFKHREFAFTLQNDAYLRYQSFATSDLSVVPHLVPISCLSLPLKPPTSGSEKTCSG